MRTLIATVAASLLTAAAAAGMFFHSASAARSKPVEGAPATQAVPGLTWRSGSATLQLTDRPCPYEEFVAQLGIEGVTPAREYVVQQGSRKITGCWSTDVGGDVVTMEPGRELGQIPINWFRTDRGA